MPTQKGKRVKVLLVLIAISIEAHGQCDPKTAEKEQAKDQGESKLSAACLLTHSPEGFKRDCLA